MKPSGKAETGDNKNRMSVDRSNKQLDLAIGRQIREFRLKLQLTIQQLSKLAGVSGGMLSKIENGHASPSLSTLMSLAGALRMPVTAFFRKFDEEQGAHATFVHSGQGQLIRRRGSQAGYEYRFLGHSLGKSIAVEPYLVTLTENVEAFPIFQHPGLEFIYTVEGKLVYRYGEKTYVLSQGDSLFFDSDVAHGPEELIETPSRLLAVIVYHRYSNDK
jgi:transcriptional regulator with XRE-family HTH domain